MPKLAIFSKFSQGCTLFMEPETKEEKLRNDVRKLYLRNHEKTRHLGWILVKTWRRKQEENVGLLGDFSGNWQLDLPKKIGPKHKFGRVFWKIFILQSWRGLKTLWIHIKWAHKKVVYPTKRPSKAADDACRMQQLNYSYFQKINL